MALQEFASRRRSFGLVAENESSPGEQAADHVADEHAGQPASAERDADGDAAG